MRKSYNEATNEITFTFEGQDDITVNMEDFSDEILKRFQAHGALQKLGDAAALKKGATDAERHEAVTAALGRVLNGEWNSVRKGNPDGLTPSLRRLREAVTEFMNDNDRGEELPDDAGFREKLLDKDWASSARKIPAVAVILRRMEEEDLQRRREAAEAKAATAPVQVSLF